VDIRFRARIKAVRDVWMSSRDAAIRVAAQAHDFHLFSDALAVVATEFLSLGGKAGTGCIGAFPEISHDFSLVGPVGVLLLPGTRWRFATDAEDHSAKASARTSKIAQLLKQK
jgi:hypothetical protein